MGKSQRKHISEPAGKTARPLARVNVIQWGMPASHQFGKNPLHSWIPVTIAFYL